MKDTFLLQQYSKSISKYPRVTPAEEIELAKKIRNGDEIALNSLINANLRFVVKIALGMCKGNFSIMDIIQNGNLGLIKAAKKFDPDREVRFSTYSAFWIKQSILRGFIKPSVGLSVSYRKDEINKRIKTFIKDEFAEKGRLPNIEEIETALKVKRRDAYDALMLFKNNGDLQTGRNLCANNENFIESIEDNHYNPEKITETKFLNTEIEKVINSFPKRESDIIKNRYEFENCSRETLSSLGHKYSISAEATRQIEKRVLLLIRTRFPSLAYYFYS